MSLLNNIIFNNFLFLPEIFLIFILPVFLLFLILTLINSDLKKNLNFASFNFNLIFILYFFLILKNLNSINVGFNGSLHVNYFLNFFKLLIIVISIILAFYAIFSLKYDNLYSFEFFFLLSMAIFGSIVVISSGNLITFILGLEMQSLSLYILIAIRSSSIISVESSIKYFLVGVVSSILTFVGIFFIYLNFNTIYFIELQQIKLINYSLFWVFILLFLLAIVFFKLSVFPFQFWAPDVYQSAQNSIVLFITTVSKIVIVIFLIRLLCVNILFPNFYLWNLLINPFIIITIVLGAIRGLIQNNIKRILAYSSMVNIGFILLPLTNFSYINYTHYIKQFYFLNLNGSEKVKVSMFTLTIFYLFVYVLLSLIFFLILMVLKKLNYNKRFKDIKILSDLNGLHITNPKLAFILLSILLSLSGLPPFLGFFNKYFILIELMNQKHFFLAFFVLFFSIVSMFYYIKIIKAIYFEKNQNLSDSTLNYSLKLNILNKNFFVSNSYLINFIYFLNFFNVFGFISFFYFYKLSFNLSLMLILNNII